MGYVNWSYERAKSLFVRMFLNLLVLQKESGNITRCIAHRRFIWI